MELVETKYKQTEVGLIPEDWEVKTLGDVGEVRMCKRIFSYQTKENGDIPFYKIGTFGKTPDAYISKEIYNEYKRKYSFPSKGSVLISAAGTIGRTIIFNGEDAYFQDSNIVWIENNNQVISNEYLRHVFPFVKFRTEGGTIQRLYNNILKSGFFPSPPTLSEQKAIARVLSDTDALIQALEKKIAKKKLIKKGAMQELLRPKEGWEEVQIQDLIHSFQNGYGFNASGYVRNGIPIVTMAQIGLNGSFQYDERKINFWKREDFNSLKNFHLKNGDIIIAMTDVTPDKNLIGRMTSVVSNKTLLLNQRVGLLRINKERIDPLFLTTISNMRDWRRYCIGSASLGVQANIGTKDILQGQIKIPRIEEQTRISLILSAMEKEIEQLEQKLGKYKKVKQGMMQQLLTGKIRLV